MSKNDFERCSVMGEPNKAQRVFQKCFYRLFGYTSMDTFWAAEWRNSYKTICQMDKGLRRQARHIKRLQKEIEDIKSKRPDIYNEDR